MLDLLERLMDSPIGRQLTAAEQKRTQGERQVLVKKLADVTRREEKALPPLAKQREAAMRAHSAATKALKEAETEINRAVTADRQARRQFDRERDDHQAALRKTADPAIDEFIAEHRAVLDKERRDWLWLRHIEEKRDGYGAGGPTYAIWTNEQAMKERHESIRAAIESAEALKLEAVVDVADQLDKLRATIPALDDLELRQVA